MRVVLVLPLLLAGCVTELLQDDETTTRNIACAFLTDERPVVLQVQDVAGLGLEGAWTRVVAELSNATGRDATTIRVVTKTARLTEEEWVESREPLGRELGLYVLVLDRLDPPARLVEVAGPGAMRIGAEGIESSGLDPEDAYVGALLHGFGHLLGVVNRGIPISDANASHREGMMHHEGEESSIMHTGWHHAGTVKARETYRYSDGIRRDWEAAKAGVCA